MDSLGIATVFDTWSYILLLLSCLVVSLVLVVTVVCRRLVFPMRYTHTILYVVAAFFQETYPKSKLPKEGFKVWWGCHCRHPCQVISVSRWCCCGMCTAWSSQTCTWVSSSSRWPTPPMSALWRVWRMLLTRTSSPWCLRKAPPSKFGISRVTRLWGWWW